MPTDRSQSPDAIERIGIVIWKIAVLVIALRCTLALVPQQALLDALTLGSTVLQTGALVLIAAGSAWALIRFTRARSPWLARTGAEPARPQRRIPGTYASLAPNAAHNIQHLMWRGSNWMLALGLESLLAAQIIQVSTAYAGPDGLSWWRVGLVGAIAIGRILM